jgi:16S rRNA U1498 N3-methylase RsmE
MTILQCYRAVIMTVKKVMQLPALLNTECEKII